MHRRLGHDALAKNIYENVLAINRQTEYHGSRVQAAVGLGYTHLRLDEPAQARQQFELSLQLYQSIGDIGGVVYAVEGLAGVAALEGQALKATRLYAWADRVREEMKDPRPAFEQIYVDKCLAAVQQMLPKDAFQSAWLEGNTMTMDHAIHDALSA